jgi:hypothetical protein
MTTDRKASSVRQKELRLAILRIEQGRSHTNAKSLSVLGVAREAGVSAGLIHNHYPAIAELIREKNGASSRAQRDAKHQELSAERKKTSALRKELKATVMRVAKLASINETLTVENEALKARLSAKNVVQLPRE